MAFDFKQTKTDYKYVRKLTYGNGTIKYQALYPLSKLNNHTYTRRSFDDIKEAAKSIDVHLINQGKEPVNILVRK